MRISRLIIEYLKRAIDWISGACQPRYDPSLPCIDLHPLRQNSYQHPGTEIQISDEGLAQRGHPPPPTALLPCVTCMLYWSKESGRLDMGPTDPRDLLLPTAPTSNQSHNSDQQTNICCDLSRGRIRARLELPSQRPPQWSVPSTGREVHCILCHGVLIKLLRWFRREESALTD